MMGQPLYGRLSYLFSLRLVKFMAFQAAISYTLVSYAKIYC